MDWLRAARLFVNVVQGGSLSSAGRRFGLSPASVSRHISALEDSVGSRLLNRTSRKLTLTEAGEIYFRQTEHILHQITEANESVALLQTAPRGTLRVHSRVLVGHQYIVPALPKFLAAYPDIRLDLLMSNRVVDLVEQNIDVDIRIGKLDDSSLMVRKLATAQSVVSASPAYLARHPPVDAPTDLINHNCLAYRLDLSRPMWRFVGSDGKMVEVPVAGSLLSDSGQALLSATLAGVGVSLMPDWAIRDDVAAGRLAPLLTQYRASHVAFDNGVYAVFQKTRQRSPKVASFVDFLADLFKRRLADEQANRKATG